MSEEFEYCICVRSKRIVDGRAVNSTVYSTLAAAKAGLDAIAYRFVSHGSLVLWSEAGRSFVGVNDGPGSIFHGAGDTKATWYIARRPTKPHPLEPLG